MDEQRTEGYGATVFNVRVTDVRSYLRCGGCGGRNFYVPPLGCPSCDAGDYAMAREQLSAEMIRRLIRHDAEAARSYRP